MEYAEKLRDEVSSKNNEMRLNGDAFSEIYRDDMERLQQLIQHNERSRSSEQGMKFMFCFEYAKANISLKIFGF